MKKVGSLSTSKSGTSSLLVKSSGKTPKPVIFGPKMKSTPVATTKNYLSSSYTVPKKGKSTSFGFIYIPTKNRNKHKELSYNSHQSDRSKDRAPSMYGNMSGDSPNHQSFLEKNKEDKNIIVPEYKEPAPIAVIGAAAASESIDIVNTGTDEKQELIKREDENTKEAAGDSADTKGIQKKDLETDEKVLTQSPKCKEKDKLEDNVDSVFLRSPPPHKARSTAASTVEEESCGMKCLYYTLQCCDCVLM